MLPLINHETAYTQCAFSSVVLHLVRQVNADKLVFSVSKSVISDVNYSSAFAAKPLSTFSCCLLRTECFEVSDFRLCEKRSV